MNINLKTHWSGVRKDWRHIVTDMPEIKKTRILYNFTNYLIKPISKTNIKLAVDWGCGGGLLTKELKTFTKVLALDICKDSLDQCKKYAQPDYTELIPNDLTEFQYNYDYADLVLAHAIVWHFPTVEYFKKVIGVWSNVIKPKYIVINTKKITNKRFLEAPNYKKNYLQALYLNDNFVIGLFKEYNYDVILSSLVTTGRQPQTYFVFRKNCK